MGNSFDRESMKHYRTLHSDLQLILDCTISKCAINFFLTEGHRPPEKQIEYFKKGRRQQSDGTWIVVNQKDVITNVDGYKVKGSHNLFPSMAVDIAIRVPGKSSLTYDIAHLSYVAGCMITIANRLYEEGKIKHKLRWGADWDRDGDLSDNVIVDKPHFELVKP